MLQCNKKPSAIRGVSRMLLAKSYPSTWKSRIGTTQN